MLAPLWLMFAPEDGNLLLVVDDPRVASVVDTLQRVLFVAIPVGTALVLGGALAARRRRRAGGRCCPGVAGAACLLLFAVMLVVQLVAGGKSPGAALDRRVLADHGADRVPRRACCARGWRGRGVADLFRDLRSIGPVELQAALARVLGDPQLLLAFPHGDGLVDAAGRPVDAARRRRRAGGHAGRPRRRARRRADLRPVARGRPRARRGDRGGGRGRAGEPAAARRGRRARLAELQASRERIVTAADAERRRIERNLHDGAQQRLVTLALQLSLIQREIRRDPAEAEQLVSSASDGARRSRWRSCASSPAASTRPRWSTAWTSRWTRWPSGRRCRRRSIVDDGPRLPAAGGVRGVLRGVGGAGQRRQARARVGGGDPPAPQRRRGRRHDHRRRGRRRRSRRGAPGCRASPTGWRPSAGGSR